MSRSQIVAEIEGLPELEAQLMALAAAGKEILNKSLFKGAGVVRDDAVARASRLSGGGEFSGRRGRMFRGKRFENVKNSMQLKDGIFRKRDKVSNQYEENIFVEAKTYYAHMIEFGHAWVVPDRAGRLHTLDKRYAPHPFMTPAYESNRGKITETIKEEARRLVLKHSRAKGS